MKTEDRENPCPVFQFSKPEEISWTSRAEEFYIMTLPAQPSCLFTSLLPPDSACSVL